MIPGGGRAAGFGYDVVDEVFEPVVELGYVGGDVIPAGYGHINSFYYVA